MAADSFRRRGAIWLRIDWPDGRVETHGPWFNIITNSGKFASLDIEFANAPTVGPWSSLGVGDGTAAPTLGDTKLQGSNVLILPFGASSRTGTAQTVAATFGPTQANFTIAEIAIFNGTVNGTSIMLARANIGPITKTAAQNATYTFNYVITAQ